MVCGLENQHFMKWLSIFSPLSKYEPALQVKTDHARFVHLPALHDHRKKKDVPESKVLADFDYF